MSRAHSIDGIFESKFTAETINKILEKGEANFFSYHIFLDDNWRKMPTGARLSSVLATEKILEYPDNPEQQEYGPMVQAFHTTSLGHTSSVHFRISQVNSSNKLEISWSYLDQHPVKFSDGKEGINCPFYIKKFVDMYKSFGLISLDVTFL